MCVCVCVCALKNIHVFLRVKTILILWGPVCAEDAVVLWKMSRLQRKLFPESSRVPIKSSKELVELFVRHLGEQDENVFRCASFFLHSAHHPSLR